MAGAQAWTQTSCTACFARQINFRIFPAARILQQLPASLCSKTGCAARCHTEAAAQA